MLYQSFTVPFRSIRRGFGNFENLWTPIWNRVRKTRSNLIFWPRDAENSTFGNSVIRPAIDIWWLPNKPDQTACELCTSPSFKFLYHTPMTTCHNSGWDSESSNGGGGDVTRTRTKPWWRGRGSAWGCARTAADNNDESDDDDGNDKGQCITRYCNLTVIS